MALTLKGNPAVTPQASIQRTKPDNTKGTSYQRFGYKSNFGPTNTRLKNTPRVINP